MRILGFVLFLLLPFALAWLHPDTDNSTAPFIFNSLSAGLSQWPNTYHPNGHSIIPALLEPYTLLYHAYATLSVPPASPEWFAFDPEMSFGIMGGEGGTTYMQTWQSTRPVKVVYFDGMSAALSRTAGWLDVQDALIAKQGAQGRVRDYDWFDEYTRARHLCEWAKPHGVEGIVRMNTGFELLWCDFASPSIRLVSYLNVTPPGTPPSPPVHLPGLPGPDGPSPDPPGRGEEHPDSRGRGTPRKHRPRPQVSPLAETAFREWLRAAAHRAFAPQAHIRLDYSSLVTFYHPRLHSLAAAREGKLMQEHRIWPNVSAEDVLSVLDELDTVLDRRVPGSGVNWGTLARGVVEHWADRVAQLHEFLTNTSSALGAGLPVNVTDALSVVRRSTYSPLNPYMDTGATGNISARDLFFHSTWNMLGVSTLDESVLFSQLQQPFLHPTPSRHPQIPQMNLTAYQRCVYSSTNFLNHISYAHKTPQEELLQTSVEAVLNRLCTDVGTLFVESMEAADVPTAEDAVVIFARWTAQTAALMRWLDWTEWLRCEEVCPRDSVCAMFMWPVTMWEPPSRPQGDDGGSGRNRSDADIDIYKPRCVSVGEIGIDMD